MQDEEKLLAIEYVIFAYAKQQFAINGISPIEAYRIIKNVLSEFQGMCLETSILSRVHIDGQQQEEPESAQSTETVKDVTMSLQKLYGGKKTDGDTAQKG